MRISPHRLFAAATFVYLIPAAVSAQTAAVGAPTPQEPTFQTRVIGLRNWTAKQVNDSLVKHFGPSQGLDSHACGANLLQIGFARSSATYFMGEGGSRKVVVALVEPQDSARIGALKLPAASQPLPTDWATTLEAFVDTSGRWLRSNELSGALQSYPFYQRGQADSARARLAAFGGKREHEIIWSFLQAHRAPEDRSAALHILTTDSSYKHRAMAVAVLSNFRDDDRIWGTLVHTIRDPNETVGLIAIDLLGQWARERPHQVDWSANTEDIRYVLAGSNLWTYLGFVQLMLRTELSPTLAKAVLADNGTYVLGYASLKDIPAASTPSRKLLARLSGTDYGDDVGRWESWIKAL